MPRSSDAVSTICSFNELLILVVVKRPEEIVVPFRVRRRWNWVALDKLAVFLNSHYISWEQLLKLLLIFDSLVNNF